MAKLCKHEGCTNPIFSNGYCSWHQSDRTDKKYLKSILNKYHKGKIKIKPRSDKRAKQEQEYREMKVELEQELKEKGEWRCIFCNMPFQDTEIPDWHHTNKRVGNMLVNKHYLKPAHTGCHITHYHNNTVRKRKMMFWYEGFLERLKVIDAELYNKEIKKEDKS